MHGAYVGAIEARLGWLRWSGSSEARGLFESTRVAQLAGTWGAYTPLAMAKHVLERGPTFFMDARFCRLVDAARQAAPGDLAYEPQWLLAPEGWLWMDEPVQAPDLLKSDAQITPGYTTLRAVGWRHIEPGTRIVVSPAHDRVAPEGMTHFLFFIGFGDYAAVARGEAPPSGTTAALAAHGFGVWSYFTLAPGMTLDDRVAQFEAQMREKDASGAYVEEAGRRAHRLHEIRWLFCALKLMSQRLASRVRVPTGRHVRRRALREGQEAPPYIDVVTLRRLHHHAIRTQQTGDVVDWQWQWVVRGHWRNQWYPADGVHKPKFIESYLKGPDDRPLKPKGAELFVARR